MDITNLLTSVTITLLPLGFLIPETSLVCWVDAWWVYFDNKIYYCDDWNWQFYLEHEKGHVIFEQLTDKQKNQYKRLYKLHLKHWINAFYRGYEMKDYEEDWSTNYSLLQTKEPVNKYIKKRQELIKNIISEI